MPVGGSPYCEGVLLFGTGIIAISSSLGINQRVILFFNYGIANDALIYYRDYGLHHFYAQANQAPINYVIFR